MISDQSAAMPKLRLNVLDTPSAANVIAIWQYREWGQHEEGVTLAGTRAWAASCIDSSRIPSAFVCYVDEQLAGTSSVIESDLPGFEHFAPWLANVYVEPKYRNLGIGRRLIERAARFATELRIEALYLYTFDKVSYYERMGWRTVETTNYVGKVITIMKRALRA